ncbi:MAG: ABC transporter permease [Acidobacteriaceae bacterium]
MFFRLLFESFARQRRRKMLAGIAILLGIAAVTAMLALATTIGDQVHRELAVYGANILVTPKSDQLAINIGGIDLKPTSASDSLKESDLSRLKGIFWGNNITGISPELPLKVQVASPSGTEVQTPAIGLWFRHTLTYGTSSFTTGAPALHPWWKLKGAWPQEPPSNPPADAPQQAVAGSALAARLNLRIGDALTIDGRPAKITGIVSTGDATDGQFLLPLALAQQLAGTPNAVRRVYISAITKPEDAFARRDPDSLSPAQRDIWYCRPYANSIAYQIQEALPGSHAEQIRQVEQGAGQILSRIEGLMWLISLGALVAASFAVSATMATAVLERRSEIGLMRSLGATRGRVALLFYSEAGILALFAGSLGFLLGSGLASWLSHRIFSSGIGLNLVLLPIMLSLALLVALAGSTSSIRAALRLDPSSILRGDA